MKHLWFLLISAVMASAPAVVAVAQAPLHEMTGKTWTVDTYLDKLGRQMSITSRQEPAWKTYAGTLSGVGHSMQGEHQAKMEAMGTASWQKRCNLVDQMLMTRKEAAGLVHKAATDLLPALNAGQKQKAKSMLPGLALPPAAGFG